MNTCANYKGPHFLIPKVGEQVRISGSWVLDKGHGVWAEIHPANTITIISSKTFPVRPITPPAELSREA